MVWWSTPRPCRFTPGKETQYTYTGVGGPQGRSVRKISSPPEFDPQAFQPLASRYTKCAILTHN